MSALPDLDKPAADRSFEVRLAPEHDQDAAVVSVRGDVDLVTAPMLQEALLPVIEHQSGPLVVDLCEVPFMDSTGVHVLLETLRRLENQDRRVAIACREDGQVQRILSLVGVLDAVTMVRAGGHDRFRPRRTDDRARRYYGNNRPPPRSWQASPTPTLRGD